MRIGLPLALAGALLGGILARPIAIEMVERHAGKATTAVALLALELVAALLAHLAIGLSMTLAISLASAAVALGCMIFWSRHDVAGALERADAHLQERWQAAMPETALFLACGLLVGVMQVPALADAAKSLVAASLPGGIWGLATLLFALPLVTVAGIHPMVPFAVLSPIISAAALGISQVGLYAMWITVFMLSMLLSPVSILTMITTANFGISGRLLGLRGNGLYAAALAAASALLIALLCGA